MGHNNTWSKKLRSVQKNRGVRILCSVAPYDGQEVDFQPRYETDREPWVLKGVDSPYRYSGRECHPDLPKEDHGDSAGRND